MEKEKEDLDKVDFLASDEGFEEKKTEDDSVYSEEAREQMVEDDELSPGEAGFMMGYDKAYT